jgi:hypothetical protein
MINTPENLTKPAELEDPLPDDDHLETITERVVAIGVNEQTPTEEHRGLSDTRQRRVIDALRKLRERHSPISSNK